jgi:2-oxo-3-hexenedioate decarboxylase
MTIDHRHWAEYLQDAVDRRVEVASITSQLGDFSLDDAYAIQDELIALKLARGERISGAKLGLTSIAKQQQMGVSEPCYGWVFEHSLLQTEDVDVLGWLIHPRVEPEFVFVMREAVSGANITATDILDATSYVCGGIEVIDSRYEAFKFTLPDVIADNTSAAYARIGAGDQNGPGIPTDIPGVPVSFRIDGVEAATASGASLLGSPAECVAMLARHLHRRGKGIEAGWTILAGAPTDAKPLSIGTEAVARYPGAFSDVRVKGH